MKESDNFLKLQILCLHIKFLNKPMLYNYIYIYYTYLNKCLLRISLSTEEKIQIFSTTSKEKSENLINLHCIFFRIIFDTYLHIMIFM